MKIINDIIMSIKNFLSYIFKDDDPTSTDLFDSNWGNGVTKALKSYSGAVTIPVRSDDREGHMKLDNKTYYLGSGERDKGYPIIFAFLINSTNKSGLASQILHNNEGIYVRNVNNSNSSLEWTRMDGIHEKYGTPISRNGTATYYKRKVARNQNIITATVFGTLSEGAGTKIIFQLPEGFRTDQNLVAGVYASGSSGFVSVPCVLDTNGELSGYFDSTMAGKAYHANFTFLL